MVSNVKATMRLCMNLRTRRAAIRKRQGSKPTIQWLMLIGYRQRTTAMKVGIAGFSGSGKSTVFRWLTGVAPDPAASQRGQIGMAKVPDERLNWLSTHFKP